MRSNEEDQGWITETSSGRSVLSHPLGHDTDTGQRQLMEDQEGGYPMCEWFYEEMNPDLEGDIYRLKDKLEDFLDFYYEFEVKHGEITRGWDMVENELWEIYWPWYRLEPITDEEE
jgi:hypothetical protein